MGETKLHGEGPCFLIIKWYKHSKICSINIALDYIICVRTCINLVLQSFYNK